MGPEASADLYQQLIDCFYKRAGSDMQGYPHIVVNSIPVPDIFQQAGTPIGKYLGEQTRLLENAGTQLIGIACNSTHNYLEEIIFQTLSGVKNETSKLSEDHRWVGVEARRRVHHSRMHQLTTAPQEQRR